ncbi:MAG: ATP-binding protein [Candidatus Nanohaloarchaeota archaeon]|nr:ATP-binding protein [Candidatus Nanohaloarchaeota archaeon]
MHSIGKIVSASSESIIIKVNQQAKAELGMLLYVKTATNKVFIYQSYELLVGSQTDQKEREYIAEMLNFEKVEIKEEALRHYVLMKAKPLAILDDNTFKSVKSIPPLYAEVYEINEELASLISTQYEGIDIGRLRSGSEELPVSIHLNINKMLTHHIFVGATTGRGKSNFLKVLVAKLIKDLSIGFVIFDPHDEYIGRGATPGLKELRSEKVIYYSAQPLPSYPYYHSLIFNLTDLRPSHFMGVFEFSEPQQQAMYLLWRYANERWVETLLTMKKGDKAWSFLTSEGNVDRKTIEVLKRKIMVAINAGLQVQNEEISISYHGSFKKDKGETTLINLLQKLEEGYKIIIDTSSLSYTEELLIMSMISENILNRYKRYKQKGELEYKAKVGLIIEEAPRVLGRNVLVSNNIFGSIAREGRKFNIGIIAVTQLPSLIPDEILANMNTKIILGIEMAKEREAIISSAPHDLSKDSKVIASLEKGEAIVTSIFTGFPLPLKIYKFDDIIKEHAQPQERIKISGFKKELEI